MQTIILEDGCTWTGQLDAFGVRNGTGTKTYPNGAKYTGTWVNNVRHGAGVKTWADGTERNVIYNNGLKAEAAKPYLSPEKLNEALHTLEMFVEQWAGEPCATHEDECPVCEDWKALNRLRSAYADLLHMQDLMTGE